MYNFRKFIPKPIFKLGTCYKLARRVPPLDVLRLCFRNRITKKGSAIPFRVRGHSEELVCRAKTSDFHTLCSAFVGNYHLPPASLPAHAHILDLGSNVGYTLVDLGLRYPEASIVGYEMDETNFRLASDNISILPNCEVVHAAVAGRSGLVHYHPESDADAFSIAADTDRIDEKFISVTATTIPEILEAHGWSRVDYLKMDIEGAEAFLLEPGVDLEWLRRVDRINIEVHSPLNPSDFVERLTEHGFHAWKDTRHWSAVLAVRTEKET